MLLVLQYHRLSLECAFTNNLLYLTINCPFQLLAIRFGVLGIRKSNIAQLCTHTKLCNNMIGQVVGLLKIVISTSGHFVKKVLLCTTTT